MAHIKSALELAMERASNIKIDKTDLKRKELEQKGKEAASSFLNKPKFDFSKWLSELSEDERETTLNGTKWVFSRNIKLPNSTADVDTLVKIKEGYLQLTDKTEIIEELFKNLVQVYQQYIDNSKTVLEQCKQEYAPKLQQKAMQIAQQTGQMIPIEPEQDRDFLEFHKTQQSQVDNHFKGYIDQITAELAKL